MREVLLFAALMAAFCTAGWFIGMAVAKLRNRRDDLMALANATRPRCTAPTPCGCPLCAQTDYWFFGAFVAIAVNNPDLTAVGRAITADLYGLPEEDPS
jgi:hypothetical protein